MHFRFLPNPAPVSPSLCPTQSLTLLHLALWNDGREKEAELFVFQCKFNQIRILPHLGPFLSTDYNGYSLIDGLELGGI